MKCPSCGTEMIDMSTLEGGARFACSNCGKRYAGIIKQERPVKAPRMIDRIKGWFGGK